MSICHSDESLRRLGAASIGEAEFVSLEKHIEGCAGCQAALERLARSGGATEAPVFLREPHQAPAFARFVLEHELGRGSMGVVYRAWQPDLARHIAIKLLKRSDAASQEERQRWLTEARAHSRVRHPGIVQIYEIGEDEGWLYLVLELVRGGDLKDRLAKPLPPQIGARFAENVARAVAELHKAGLLHLDLKPSNILLDGPPDVPWEQMTPMIGDFGIARVQHHLAASENTLRLAGGTPSYMAPEQTTSNLGDIGPPADIYAIGATLYHFLTGRPPFLGASVTETLDQVRQCDPIRPRQLVASIPLDLETICLKSLRKSPKERYASAIGLADDLRRFLNGEPVKARPVGPAGRAWMWCRRNPGTTSLVAALLLALLTGIAGITVEWRNAEASRQSAVASDVEAQQLLTELVESNPLDARKTFRSVASMIDVLHKAETHCKNLLQKNPDEVPIRIALTTIYDRLNSLYCQRGQATEAEAIRRQARALWEPPANVTGKAEWKYWLAATYSWDDDSVPRFFQSGQQAEAIWQELAQDQPANLDLMLKLWSFRTVMAAHFGSKAGEAWFSQLKESKAELERLVYRNPGDRPLRKRLALRCFLLGEAYIRSQSADEASAFWRESYEHYKILTDERPDDLLDNISLAISCSRLIHDRTDPYYLHGIARLDASDRRLRELLSASPKSGWLRDLLLEDYCSRALCHAKAGQTEKAEQAALECAQVLAMRLDGEDGKLEIRKEHAIKLITCSHLLQEAKQRPAALRLARQAAALCSQLALDLSQDAGARRDLVNILVDSSALANQLGDPALALEQAELARGIIETWMRTAFDDPHKDEGLAGAWERIAKARWNLGQRDQALAAFRESAAIEKRIFEREPSHYVNRVSLSQCYNRLIHYDSIAGDLQVAADAISARTALWPNNTQQLAKSADDFDALAKQVTARVRGRLSAPDQAERDHYLNESQRLRQAAKLTAEKTGRELSAER